MTEKCDEYVRRKYEGLAPLTQEVRHIAKPILGTCGLVNVDIMEHWIDIVGPDLAQGIKPVHLTFDKDKRIQGTLHVKSAGGAFAMIFEHQKKRVIDKINTFFGYPAVSQIKIQQGALRLKINSGFFQRHLTADEEEILQQKIAKIEDPDLRQKAYNIGKEMILKK